MITIPFVRETDSAEQTEQIGAELATYLLTHRENGQPIASFIAMRGDLGVGKTAFTRGFVSVVAPGAIVRSPTFSLVNEYRNRETRLTVYHMDVYRIDGEDDLYSIGFYDYLDDENSFSLVEWSEKIEFALPSHRYQLVIEKTDVSRPDRRRITITEIGKENT